MNVLLQFWGPSDDVHEAYVAEAVEVNCFVFHSGVSNHTWQDILSLRSMLGESSGVVRQLSFSSSNPRANSAVIMPPIGSVSCCLFFLFCVRFFYFYSQEVTIAAAAVTAPRVKESAVIMPPKVGDSISV